MELTNDMTLGDVIVLRGQEVLRLNTEVAALTREVEKLRKALREDGLRKEELTKLQTACGRYKVEVERLQGIIDTMAPDIGREVTELQAAVETLRAHQAVLVDALESFLRDAQRIDYAMWRPRIDQARAALSSVEKP